MRDIVQVKALLPKSTRVPGIGDDTPPFSGVYFFKVETKRNSVSYFFVRTKEERDEWIAAIETAVNALKKETVSGLTFFFFFFFLFFFPFYLFSNLFN